MSGHFTAVLEVTKTTPGQEARGREWDRDRRVEVPSKPAVARDVAELARVTVRASSLDDLTTKLAAHVALITE